MKKATLLVVLLAVVPPPALADIVGRASVIDGDKIEIRGQRIRLFGVDSPESSQLCTAPRLYYTFAVKLTETIRIVAPSEDEARDLLARGFYYGPSRQFDYKAAPRILDQELRQDEIELLAVEDPMAALEVEDSVYMDPVEVGRKLEERWQRLVARVDALEKKVGQ